VQGPIGSTYTILNLLGDVDRVYEKMARKPRTFVLRLPRPWAWEVERGFSDSQREGLEMIRDPGRAYRVVQPPRVPGRDMADQDLGADLGWRQGVISLPSDDDTSEVVRRSYTVWTPIPPGLKWPCSI
jgi:hypothetical protein